MRDNTSIGFHEAQALSEWQKLAAKRERYADEPAPLDAAAIQQRSHELLATGDRLLSSMSLRGRK